MRERPREPTTLGRPRVEAAGDSEAQRRGLEQGGGSSTARSYRAELCSHGNRRAGESVSAAAPVETFGESPGPDAFLWNLERLAARRYHHRHPFNLMMHAGRLDADDLRLWVANRYYYQTRIPIKDALILSKAEDPAFRRVWIERLREHDGRCEGDADGTELDSPAGGLELWLRLGGALGLRRDELEAGSELLPAVRQACDEYVELVRSADLLEAVASSLTEHFAATLMQVRIDAWLTHYPFVNGAHLEYFRRRVERAPIEADFALRFVCEHATSEADQRRCLMAFEKKCDILWRLLDAVYIQRRVSRRPRLESHAWLMKLGRDKSAPGAEGQRPVVLVPEKALGLNDSAFELISRCDAQQTLGEITQALSRDYAVGLGAVQLDVASFVAELERRRILAFEP